MRTAQSATSRDRDNLDPLPVEQHSSVPAVKTVVCMIAYTDYAIDARVRREAETLIAGGFRVICLTTSNRGIPARLVQDGVEVRELGVPKYRGKSTVAYIGSYVRFLLSSTVACIQLLIRGELDIVHVHNIPDFLVLAGLIPRLAGCKVVLDVHDSVPETFATKFSSNSYAWKAICVNQPQRDVLVGRGIPSSKTFVSMNVPDPKIFIRSSATQGPACAEAFDLIYHGTMADRLGVDLIIRAVARLQTDIPGVRLHLWGHGDDLSKFQRIAKELEVERRILFRPEGFPLHELPHQLRSMDLGVVGNRRSAATDLMLPVKLMEYVSLGIAAVVPRLKAIEHYFSDDMVGYYEPGDVASLADAVRRLHRDPQSRRRQAEAAARFLDQYGWETGGGELVTAYRRIMEN
jgi:glycosyltransferase involved in cell wall biosynthesis